MNHKGCSVVSEVKVVRVKVGVMASTFAEDQGSILVGSRSDTTLSDIIFTDITCTLEASA